MTSSPAINGAETDERAARPTNLAAPGNLVSSVSGDSRPSARPFRALATVSEAVPASWTGPPAARSGTSLPAIPA